MVIIERVTHASFIIEAHTAGEAAHIVMTNADLNIWHESIDSDKIMAVMPLPQENGDEAT